MLHTMKSFSFYWIFSFLSIAYALQSHGQMAIDIAQVTDGTFRQKSVRSLNWMNDGQFYSALSENSVLKYSVLSGEPVETLVNGDELNIDITSYSFSDDESLILLMTDRQSIYRRSYTAVFYLYDRKSKELKKLSSGRQSYASISPDNKKVAFTRSNNLYYVEVATGNEVAVTKDGKFNRIINGSTDWVYEEELYLTKAFEWSPDSKRLAYYRFDESKVKQYNMQVWNDGDLYPEDYVYKYPKAGEQNSTVDIFLYELSSKRAIQADLGQDEDIYIPKIAWTKDPEILSVQRLNRLQNQLDILHIDVTFGKSSIVLSDKSKSYIDFTFCDDLTYLDNGKQFLYSSEKDGYKHFYLHGVNGRPGQQLTSGAFEAVSMVGINQKEGVLYYISTEDSPRERNLYAVGFDGKNKKRLSQRGYSSVNMSPDCSYYMHYFSTPSVPNQVSLYQTADNVRVKIMEDNAELKKKITAYNFVNKEFFTIKNDEGDELDGFFLRPKDFDSNKKYPLLIYQYSGPGSQNVNQRWGGSHYIYHQYLAQQGYIIAVIDTRGTGYRGEAFKKMTYKQLGKYETQDLISVAKTLAGYAYIDEERIGIWGWSYGGYMSSLCILKGNDVFKTAIAVAPVTTWRFYDTIYTERYLRKPQDNPEGYDDNSPNTHAAMLEGNYLLVHGTGDDNVHFQNAVTLQNELIAAGKQFDSFYYPDQAHGLRNGRSHLYKMMANYLKEKL